MWILRIEGPVGPRLISFGLGACVLGVGFKALGLGSLHSLQRVSCCLVVTLVLGRDCIR